MIVLLALLSAFIPLSIDLYLPALPQMSKKLGTSVALVNLTLIVFFVFYAICMLLWGPLSDKYGRKRILRIGLAIFCLGSIGCALSSNIYQLILFRGLQAIGGSGATSVSMAIIKDMYAGKQRETVLAIVQAMIILAPVVAPILGAQILRFTTWHGIFWTLAGIGFCALFLSILLEETNKNPFKGSVLQVISRIPVVLKNPGFSLLLLTFSMITIPLMAFVASSSYIYINGFGLSEQEYSYFFASNAIFGFIGPLLYIHLIKYFQRRTLIIGSYSIVALSGILILNLGNMSPWLLAACLYPSTLCIMLVRPPTANLMLDQQEGDTGTASSLIACYGLLNGSLGMFLISLNWPSFTVGLGTLNLIIGILCGASWLVLSKKPFIKQIAD